MRREENHWENMVGSVGRLRPDPGQIPALYRQGQKHNQISEMDQRALDAFREYIYSDVPEGVPSSANGGLKESHAQYLTSPAGRETF